MSSNTVTLTDTENRMMVPRGGVRGSGVRKLLFKRFKFVFVKKE